MGGVISQVWGGSSAKYGEGGVINQLWVGGSLPNYGGGYHHAAMGVGVSSFPPVCTGTQNPQNYFSNTYVLPSVNRTAGPTRHVTFIKMTQIVAWLCGCHRTEIKHVFVSNVITLIQTEKLIK